MIAKKRFLKLLPLFLVPSILSCSHFTPMVIETPAFKKWVSSSDAPKVIAILPFTNETEVEGLGKLEREFSFLNPIVVRRENIDNLSTERREVAFCDLQLASFKLQEGALYISSKLSQHRYKPFLTETNNNGELWYRVMVGHYVSREEALYQQVKLKKEFIFLSPIVVKNENRPKDNG